MPAAAALIGIFFCLWIVSVHVIRPTEIQWLMKTDWHFQFLGWHSFRNEPWQWPPGVVERFHHAPDGTSIGYTDSIPLVAFALKPLSPVLPMPFQYISLWWLFCFAMQGVFAVLLIRLWTASVATQLLGASLLILAPILLARAVHPSLCSHWILLWCLWLYLRVPYHRAVPTRHLLGIGGLAGLIHPYIAAMALGLLLALVIRLRRGALILAAATLVVLGEWWLSGMFLLSGGDLARQGLSDFSTNLLAVITPSGWSRFLPELPVAAGLEYGQTAEGMQYLGAGSLALCLIATLLLLLQPRRFGWKALSPLLAIVIGFAIYSLSPRVTLGRETLFDISSPALERMAMFRVTGRFFWPLSYTLLVGAIALVTRRLPQPAATAVLAGAVALQLADLHPRHQQFRALARDANFLRWDGELKSPVWQAALPHYDHLVLYLPAQCGGHPATFEGPAYLAGFFGLTVNAGQSSRWSETARVAYCAALDDALAAGRTDDRAVYLVHRPYEVRLRQHAPQLVCGDIDRLRVCVTRASYARWQRAARFE